MGDNIRFKRGPKTDLLAYTPQIGEPVLTNDTKELYLGDGTTQGGIKIGGAIDTSDYSLYVTSTTYGGTTTGTGRSVASGSNTSIQANKLVDTNAAFTAAKHLNKTVYNVATGQWAKVTNVDSTTVLSLSVDIMLGSAESYVICDAVTTIQKAWDLIPSPFYSNITVVLDDLTFSESSLALSGRIAAGNFKITIKGDASNNSTLSGATVDVTGQKVFIDRLKFSGCKVNLNYGAVVVWSNCPLLGGTKVYAYNGSDTTWDNCDGTGTIKLFTYVGSASLIKNTTGITVANDPQGIRKINSTLTIGYTSYVAPAAIGGNDLAADGLEMYSGTATSTTANKLVDSAANFGTDAALMTVYNPTDDTWAKVTARDSATQLTLSADIMASGESYVIAYAFETPQAAVDALPGTVNCNTTIKVANASYAGPTIQGKGFSGSYSITLTGTLTKLYSGTASSGSTTTLTKTGAGWTVNAYQGKLVRIISGAGAGQERLILSNTADTLTVEKFGGGAPNSSSVFEVNDWPTYLTGGVQIKNGQKAINLKYFDVTYNGGTGILVDTAAAAIVYSSKIHNCTGHGLQANNQSSCTLYAVYSHNNSFAGFVVSTISFGAMLDCWIKSNSSYGFQVTSVSRGQMNSSTIESNTSHGVYGSNVAIVYSFVANSIKSNGGWGILTETGCLGNGSSINTFSGNTSGTYSPTATIAGGNT